MNEKDKAAKNLEVIRSLMERATVYRAISGPTALFAGVLAACVGFLIEPDESNFVLSWFLVLFAVVVINTILVVVKARRESRPIFSPGLRMALVAVSPALIFGGGFALFNGDIPDSRFLAWIWIVSYGFALVSTRTISPSSLWYLGLIFLATGLVIFEVELTANLLMGFTFGLYHIFYGLWVIFIEKDRS